jgi:ATP-dependent Clp protease ATP-binding subunit ClpA
MPAVIFISIGERDSAKSKGICLNCAKKMNTESIYDLMKDYKPTPNEINDIGSKLISMISNIDLQDFQNEFDNVGGTAIFPVKGFFSELPFTKDMKNEKNCFEKNKKSQKKKYTEMYCDILTRKAKNGKLDRVVGRENEINRIIQILCRRTKNNPCLVGEPGVGKTAVAEGLSIMIAENKVPVFLHDKEVCLLDLTALVAGTQFRGQFESRIKGLIDEVKNSGNTILFIDEVHNLVGTGDSSEGSMNAANILKPALSRGEIQVIGATTFKEYRKYIERDAALERRFQPVKVEEPSIEKTIKLIIKIKDYYEKFHRVSVSESLAAFMVELSEKYVTDRFLPDKAIDLLDESCACAALSNRFLEEYDKNSIEINFLKSRLEKIENESEIRHGDSNFEFKNKEKFEMSAKIKYEIARLETKNKSLEKEALGRSVTEEDATHVIELWTGVPASKINSNEFKKLEFLEEKIRRKIKGQNKAVSLVCGAIKRSRTHISPRVLPASFIFTGPTGVGKTELVKVLAEELFDMPDSIIRLDMSEFMEKHSVSRIIGSPPGYIGYDEAGQITEKIRQRPYSIVLFDEIEKAHPDVLSILLQILDEGVVSDSHGRKVSFKNTIIVMTSNVGSNANNSVGFGASENEINKKKIMKSLQDFLRPEFLSRIDEIVIFNKLTKENLIEIARAVLAKFRNHIREKGMDFEFEEDVLEFLVEKLKDSKDGARGIKNLVRKEVEDKFAEMIVKRGSFEIGKILLRKGLELELFHV